MKRKYNVVIAFLLTLLMVLGGGVMAFADTPVDGASGTDPTVTSSDDQGQGQNPGGTNGASQGENPGGTNGASQGENPAGPAVNLPDGGSTGPAVNTSDGITGSGVEEDPGQPVDLDQVNLLQSLDLQKGKATSIHLHNQSGAVITGVTVVFTDGPSLDLEPQNDKLWTIPDAGEQVLGNIEKVTVTFKNYGAKDYIFPDDFGPQGGKTTEPIEYSAEGSGSGSINLWLNKVLGVENPSISLIKSVSPSTVTTKAAVVTYTFTVTNTGNTDLTNVVLTDPLLNLNIKIGKLKEGAVYTTSATFDLGNLKDKDWSSDKFTNTAKVVGTFEEKSVSDTAEATVTYKDSSNPDPKLSIEKKVRLADSDASYKDDLTVSSKTVSVEYQFVVTNEGNVDLTDVSVNDQKLGWTSESVTLPAGESHTFTTTYEIAAENWDKNGKFVNTATAVGTFEEKSVSDTDVATVTYKDPSIPDPSLSIEKKVKLADSDASYVDELTVRNNTVSVEYQFVVTNTGNVTLDKVQVNDAILDWTSESVTLTAGESHTFTTTHAIAAKDWDNNGVFVNTASAAGIYNDAPVTADPDDATVIYHDSTTSKAAILLQKEVSTPKVDSKTANVTYKFTIKNIGDIDLFEVWLGDPAIGQPHYSIDNLAAGETTTASIAFDLSLLGTSTYGNWSGNTFTNHATVTGYYEGEEEGNSSVTATSFAVVTYSGGGSGNTGGGGGPRGPRGGNTTTIPEEPVPTAPAPVTPETPVILDEAVPAGALPQTGGIDALILYGLGTLLAGGGFVLRRREKSK